MWKQVRRHAGAVMCETRESGIRWPCWHALVFGNEITIDMRYVCPKDVRKMQRRKGLISILEEVGSEA